MRPDVYLAGAGVADDNQHLVLGDGADELVAQLENGQRFAVVGGPRSINRLK